MGLPLCMKCEYCEELGEESARCSNADLADEVHWADLYYTQGFLDIPYPAPGDDPCFWFVPKK